ncbi:hypothetical protein AB0L57_25450 [Nocardia sp. NPDC052254]|uniref:hypothetical protein n=1 Tax=Nocardia sp. NPDC052254 TaxID=3155681 RepID=UPI00342B0448
MAYPPPPDHPRIFVIDPAPGDLAVAEVEVLSRLGLVPTVNVTGGDDFRIGWERTPTSRARA